MQKIERKWTVSLIALAFAATFTVTFLAQTKLAEDTSARLIRIKIEDAKQQLKISNENLNKIRKENDERLLTKAYIFSEILAANPKIVKDANRLTEVKDLLRVDELDIIDHNGIITASTKPEFIGFDMNTSEQARAFLPILTDNKIKIVQEPMPISFDSKTIMQYAGVARKDAKGLVQVAYTPSFLAEAMEIADIKNFALGFRIGTEGKILLVKDDKIVSTNNTGFIGKNLSAFGIESDDIQGTKGSFSLSTDRKDQLCVYDNSDDISIIGCIPEREVYMSRNSIIWQLMVLFTLLFMVVLFLAVKTKEE